MLLHELQFFYIVVVINWTHTPEGANYVMIPIADGSENRIAVQTYTVYYDIVALSSSSSEITLVVSE